MRVEPDRGGNAQGFYVYSLPVVVLRSAFGLFLAPLLSYDRFVLLGGRSHSVCPYFALALALTRTLLFEDSGGDSEPAFPGKAPRNSRYGKYNWISIPPLTLASVAVIVTNFLKILIQSYFILTPSLPHPGEVSKLPFKKTLFT